jgi:hypothetical protein
MKYQKILLAFYIIIFSFSNSFSQSYIPIDTINIAEKKLFLANYKLRHESNIEQVKDQFSGEIKKKLQKIYIEQFESFSKDIDKGELYFDKENQDYLKLLLSEIQKSNTDLKNLKFNINFSRATSPNAFSVGDGTLIVHLDLLNTLSNEAELVSVLCHEIAHFKLNHRNKSVQKHVEKLTSKELKKEEREINSLKYNKQKRAEKLIQDVVYSRKSKSRIHEIEADSLGFVFYKNTNYNPAQVINSLAKLESSDIEKDSLIAEDYKKFFTTKNQKFVDEWLEMEDFSKYHYSKEHIFKWNVDSLKTHPDCAERINTIKSKKFVDKPDFNIDSKAFNKLKLNAQYERVYNFYFFKEYGFGLYEALKLLKIKKVDTFLTKMIYENLALLTKSKKEMKLNTYIPSINPKEQTNSQQLFFNFINNLTLKELETITNDYKDLIN